MISNKHVLMKVLIFPSASAIILTLFLPLHYCRRVSSCLETVISNCLYLDMIQQNAKLCTDN